MMGRFRESAWLRAVVTTLYVVVAATMGFAHKSVTPIQAPDSDLALLQLPDGSLPVLCLSSQDGEGDKRNHADGFAGCDACRLTEAPGLGAVDPPGLAPLAPNVLGPAAPRCEAAMAVFFFSATARGPPSGSNPTA